jgi:hypothetical protein
MSLIAEALRKQEQEEARRRNPSAPPAQTTAAATPDTGTPDAVMPRPAAPASTPSAAATALAQPPRPAEAVTARRAKRVAAGAVARPLATLRREDHPGAAGAGRAGLAPDPNRQKNITLWMLAGVASLIGLLMVGVLVLLFFHRPAAKAVPAPPVGEMTLHSLTSAVTIPYFSASAPAEKPFDAVRPPLPPVVPVVPVPPAAPTAPPVPPVAEVAVTPPPVPPVVVTTSAPAVSSAATVAASAAAPWPEIDIGGTFSAGGKTLVVLRGGLTLEPGATAPNGVSLVEVAGGVIQLSYKGQRRTYRLSGRTYICDPAATSP